MDKILKIQNEIGKLSKDKENPFFHSSYFDLNQILDKLNPLLEKYQLGIIQPLGNVDGRPALNTVVLDNDGSEVFRSTVTLPDLQDPQKMGGAITYYRRYALQALFLLQAEDTDGEIGQHAPKKLTQKDLQAKNKADKDNGVDPLLEPIDEI